MRAWQHRFRALAARFQREYAHQRKVVTRGTVDARTGKFSLRVMTQDVHSRKLTTFTVGGGMPANWGEPDATRALSDVASRAE